MANKTGVVRKGRTLVVGTKKDGKLVKESFGPGKEVQLEQAEYERLFKASVVAPKGSEEAQTARAAADQLPAGFPGIDALKKAGIATYSALAEVEDLTELKGIGEATAAEIEKLLDARKK